MKDNEDGTVTDETTCLMWQKHTPETKMIWKQAKIYCQELKLGGHTDWRLPTIKELLSIVDYTKYWPAINDYFSEAAQSFYWSSTIYARYTDYAWGVNFGFGDDDGYYTLGSGYVRAVRGS